MKIPGLHHFIIARNGATYARMRFNVGPRSEMVIPVEVDFTRPFAGTDHEAWEAEYQANVQIGSLFGVNEPAFGSVIPPADDFLDQFEIDRHYIEQMYADGEIDDRQLNLLLDDEHEELFF